MRAPAAMRAKKTRIGRRGHQQRGAGHRHSQCHSNYIALHQTVLQYLMDLTLNLENECGTLPCLQDLGAEKNRRPRSPKSAAHTKSSINSAVAIPLAQLPHAVDLRPTDVRAVLLVVPHGAGTW